MKATKINSYEYKYTNSFPKVLRSPQKGQVWFALFPYQTLGNMEKMRPVLIDDVYDDSVVCRKITTNKKFCNKKIKGVLAHGKHFKSMNKDSYVSSEKVEIPIYKLYGLIRDKVELEGIK